MLYKAKKSCMLNPLSAMTALPGYNFPRNPLAFSIPLSLILTLYTCLRTCNDCRWIFDWTAHKLFNIKFSTIYYCSHIPKNLFFLKQFGLGIPINSSLVQKGKINLNSFSINRIHVLNILLPDPVAMPKISQSIFIFGLLLSLK